MEGPRPLGERGHRWVGKAGESSCCECVWAREPSPQRLWDFTPKGGGRGWSLGRSAFEEGDFS